MRQTLQMGQPMTPQKSYFNRKRRQWRNDKMKGIHIWHVYKRHKDKKHDSPTIRQTSRQGTFMTTIKIYRKKTMA